MLSEDPLELCSKDFNQISIREPSENCYPLSEVSLKETIFGSRICGHIP